MNGDVFCMTIDSNAAPKRKSAMVVNSFFGDAKVRKNAIRDSHEQVSPFVLVHIAHDVLSGVLDDIIIVESKK